MLRKTSNSFLHFIAISHRRFTSTATRPDTVVDSLRLVEANRRHIELFVNRHGAKDDANCCVIDIIYLFLNGKIIKVHNYWNRIIKLK